MRLFLQLQSQQRCGKGGRVLRVKERCRERRSCRQELPPKAALPLQVLPLQVTHPRRLPRKRHLLGGRPRPGLHTPDLLLTP